MDGEKKKDQSSNQSSSQSSGRNSSKSRRFLGIALALIGIIILISGSIAVTKVLENKPVWSPKDLDADGTTFIYDMKGQVIAELHGEENRIPVTLEQIPEHVQQAFIAIEDARFYLHKGVDVRAIARAAFANLRNNRVVEGGSTITQQLAKNAILSREKTFDRKIKEAMLAYDLEKSYSKEEILELYLNRVYFGHGAYGVQSAAKLYFDKDVSKLSLVEGALLAGLIRAPNYYSPYSDSKRAEARTKTVLSSMEKNKFIGKSQLQAALEEGYQVKEKVPRDEWRHPYFVDYVIEYTCNKLGITEEQLFRGGYRIYTTLDPETQKAAEATLGNNSYFPPSKADQLIQGAMVVLDYRTGAIKALVGGRKSEVKRGFNRATEMRRQPGSSLKPIVSYAPALEAKYPPYLILNDAPTIFKGGYAPKNSNGRFMGPIDMRTAIQYSVNIYSVKLLDLIGVETGYNFARKLELNLVDTDKVLALALGGITYGVTPLEMARAYGAFANQGILVESSPVTRAVDSDNRTIFDFSPQKKVAMSKQTAYLTTELLQRVVRGGTATAARMTRPVAGKTGTSQVPDTKEFRGLGRAHKDAWFVGYTPELVAAVWIGYDNTDRNHYLSVFGGNHPARIWKAVMTEALKEVPVKQFAKPEIKFKYKKGANAGVRIMTKEEEKAEEERLKKEQEKKEQEKKEQEKKEQHKKEAQNIKEQEKEDETFEHEREKQRKGKDNNEEREKARVERVSGDVEDGVNIETKAIRKEFL